MPIVLIICTLLRSFDDSGALDFKSFHSALQSHLESEYLRLVEVTESLTPCMVKVEELLFGSRGRKCKEMRSYYKHWEVNKSIQGFGTKWHVILKLKKVEDHALRPYMPTVGTRELIKAVVNASTAKKTFSHLKFEMGVQFF